MFTWKRKRMFTWERKRKFGMLSLRLGGRDIYSTWAVYHPGYPDHTKIAYRVEGRYYDTIKKAKRAIEIYYGIIV